MGFSEIQSEQTLEEQEPIISSISTQVAEFEVDKLPSRKLPYPNDCKIFVKPYTWGEMSAISASSLSSEEEKYKIVLSGIITKNVNKQDLTFPDVLFLGFFRKMYSAPDLPPFIVPYSCGICGEDNKGHFKYIDLQFADLDIPELPVIVTLNQRELHFSPLTISNYLKMIKTKAYQDDISRKSTILAHQCINLEIEEAFNIISQVTDYDDIEILKEINQLMFHEIKPVVHPCTHCKTENNISLDRMEAILLPFRESGEPAKNRIRFGNKPCS